MSNLQKAALALAALALAPAPTQHDGFGPVPRWPDCAFWRSPGSQQRWRRKQRRRRGGR